MSIVTAREVGKVRQIERLVNARFNKLEIPEGRDVCRKQFFFFMDKLLQADVSHGAYETYLPMLTEKFAHVSKEEVLSRVASLEFDRFLKYYENAEDLNVKHNDRRIDKTAGVKREPKGREYKVGAQYKKLFVNLGTRDGFYKASFLQYILDMSNLGKHTLGRIDMKELNSWVEIEKEVAQHMIKALDGKTYKGRRIRMNEA
jgi:ATP-dependent RNA helicase DeaD